MSQPEPAHNSPRARDRPIRVAMSALRYPPAIGGVERYLADVVAAGPASGRYEVAVVSSDLAVHSTGERLPGSTAVDGIDRRVARPLLGRWRYPILDGLRPSLLDLAAASDVVHASPLHYHSFDAVLRAARSIDRPLVLNLMAYPRRRTYRPYYAAVARAIRRTSSTVVHISDHELGVLRELRLVDDRTPLVRIPPLIGENPPARPVRAPLEDRALRLLFVGRLDRGKGVADLPAVFDGLEQRGLDVELTVAGPSGPAEAALAAAARDRPGMHLVGGVSDEERDRLLAEADLLVLPSRYEAFGMVLAEAMRSGAIPVAYPVGAVPEVLGHGRYGLLSDGMEPSGLATAIADALRDPDELAALRHRAWDHAAATYGRERWEAAWADLFEAVAG